MDELSIEQARLILALYARDKAGTEALAKALGLPLAIAASHLAELDRRRHITRKGNRWQLTPTGLQLAGHRD